MSVRVESANSEYLDRTASVFDYNAAYTIAGWIYPATLTGGTDTYCTLYGTHATDGSFDRCLTSGGTFPNAVRWSSYGTSGAVDSGSDAITAANWYYVVMIRTTATQMKRGVDPGTTTAFATDSMASRAAIIQILLGAGRAVNSGAVQEFSNCRFAYWRAWTVALTDGELATERTSATAVKTASLWASWPLTVHTDLTDVSGNGRNLTAHGTLSTEADPPAVILPVTYSTFTEDILRVQVA